jgi:hypothetical protein
MPEHQSPLITSLRDMPPDTMLPYTAVAHLLFGTTQAKFEEAVRKGTIGNVRGVRMTRKSPMHFRAGDVADYIDSRMSVLEQSQ